LVMKPPHRSSLTADCGKLCSASAANAEPASTTAMMNTAIRIIQYFSGTNFRPLSEA
jgi:hypothetical protein